MITVTGTFQDVEGNPLHGRLDFISQSTPQAGSGKITTNTDASLLTDPALGTFSVNLAPGNYSVIFNCQGEQTQFTIGVPTGTASLTIDTLVSSPMVYTYLAPNQAINTTGSNVRWTPGVGFEYYNFDTALWYTLIVTGSPAQLGLSTGHA